MLKNDDIVRDEELLFPWNIDVQIRVSLIEVVKGNTLNPAGGTSEVAIDPRFLERRMAKENDDAGAQVTKR
jgi:hypothetical protein